MYIYIYIHIHINICNLCITFKQQNVQFSRVAGVSRAGARSGLQLQGHRDMQGFDSSSPAILVCAQLAHASMTLSCIDFHTVKAIWLHVDTQKKNRRSRIK